MFLLHDHANLSIILCRNRGRVPVCYLLSLAARQEKGCLIPSFFSFRRCYGRLLWWNHLPCPVWNNLWRTAFLTLPPRGAGRQKDEPINAIQVTIHHTLVLNTESTTRATSSASLKRRQYQPFHFIGPGSTARDGMFNPLIVFVQVGDKYRFSGRNVGDGCVGLIVLPSPGVLLTIVHECF